MPFSPISVNAKVFNQAGEGKYMLSTVSFGQPANYFQIKGGSLNKPRTNYVATLARVLEKDVLVNGVTSRRSATVQLILTLPTVGYTSTEIDALLSDLDGFITVATLDRILSGEA